MRLSLVHRVVGLAVVALFLATGVYMERAFPALYENNESVRYTVRANHVYILLSGLVNVAIGTRPSVRQARWRRTLQYFGSGLLVLAPAVLIVAFVYEAPLATPGREITRLGILFVFLGTLCHLPRSATGQEHRLRTAHPPEAAEALVVDAHPTIEKNV